ncbi:unnamed protein product, partial [Adineta steineri]
SSIVVLLMDETSSNIMTLLYGIGIGISILVFFIMTIWGACDERGCCRQSDNRPIANSINPEQSQIEH